jgi:zinc transport system substrate-binding protein
MTVHQLMFFLRRFFACIVVATMAAFSQAQTGTMVTSTHPLYLIAKAVTAGIETPVLLLPPSSDGHHINLRPSDRLLLKKADLVLWFGRDYEAPLYGLLVHQKNAIALFDVKLFRRLPLRDPKGNAIAKSLDPHIWLDPNNAINIANYIAQVRGRQSPAHAAQYQQNSTRFAQRLRAAVSDQKSAALRYYWAYHDAYSYLESALNLKFAGALTADPELPPTIGQLIWLNQNRPHQHTMCLFAERALTPALTTKLRPVQHYSVDETMANATDFIQGWQSLAQRLEGCRM